MKKVISRIALALLVALLTTGCAGPQGPSPVVISEAGGEGHVKGTMYGVPFEIEIWYFALDVTSGQVAHCPVLFVSVFGVEAHGALPIDGIHERCFEQYGTLGLAPPTYKTLEKPKLSEGAYQ